MSRSIIALTVLLAALLLPWPTGHATALAATPEYPFAITGSETFVGNITAGLELLREQSPAEYQLVAESVTEIKEGPSNYAWGGSRSIQIGTLSASYSPTYAGSIVLHEAVHVNNWFTNNFPVFGCDGEAKSLRAQADYLYRVGDGAMGQWVEGQIGTWC